MPVKRPVKPARRVPRFGMVPAKPTFFLPPRTPAPSSVQPKPGHHTYYLSCDMRSFANYLPHAVKQLQRGFRAALLAPAGLVFEPPGIALLGLQDGDAFEAAVLWATSNPIDEIHGEMTSARAPVTLKEQKQAQDRFSRAVATLEGVAQAQKDAEVELEAATAEIIRVQGVEAIVIDGFYFDPTYSREKVYLKKRDPRFNPVDEEPVLAQKRGKKAAKRSGRAA